MIGRSVRFFVLFAVLSHFIGCGSGSSGTSQGAGSATGIDESEARALVEGFLSDASQWTVQATAQGLKLAPLFDSSSGALSLDGVCAAGIDQQVSCGGSGLAHVTASCEDVSKNSLSTAFHLTGTIRFIDCSSVEDGVVHFDLIWGPIPSKCVPGSDCTSPIDVELHLTSTVDDGVMVSGHLIDLLDAVFQGSWLDAKLSGNFSLRNIILTGDAGCFLCQIDDSGSFTCLRDKDCEGIPDATDNCLKVPNPDQADENGDGVGDACSSLDPAVDCEGEPPSACDVDYDCMHFVNACPHLGFSQRLKADGDELICYQHLCIRVQQELFGASCQPLQTPAACTGDGCSNDDDGDGIPNPVDNCPFTFNPRQGDCDGDLVGDRCDNCVHLPNPGQYFSGEITNHDSDRFGDACDPDADNDGLPNESDNCPLSFNPLQKDSDGDGAGDACDNCLLIPNDQTDGDADGVGDICDNCLNVYNPAQTDLDENGTGDACDPDADGDGIPNDIDNCTGVPNHDQVDTDGDGVGDVCDNCPNDPNHDQLNHDGDGLGDGCDPDIDGDGFLNASDNCPMRFQLDQSDVDGDGAGDWCDDCPFDNDPDQLPAPLHYCGDVCNSANQNATNPHCVDAPNGVVGGKGGLSGGLGECYCSDDDLDFDLVPSVVIGTSGVDNCPDISNFDQLNSDSDSFGDACDNCPFVSNDQTDSDHNGVGDACQPPNCPYSTSLACPVSSGGDAYCNAVADSASFPETSLECSQVEVSGALGTAACCVFICPNGQSDCDSYVSSIGLPSPSTCITGGVPSIKYCVPSP